MTQPPNERDRSEGRPGAARFQPVLAGAAIAAIILAIALAAFWGR